MEFLRVKWPNQDCQSTEGRSSIASGPLHRAHNNAIMQTQRSEGGGEGGSDRITQGISKSTSDKELCIHCVSKKSSPVIFVWLLGQTFNRFK